MSVNILSNKKSKEKVRALEEEDLEKLDPERVLRRMRVFAHAEGFLNGLSQGRADGIIEGQPIGMAKIVRLQLRENFGRLDKATKAQIKSLSYDELTRLGKALLRFKTRSDLDKWLLRHTDQTQATHEIY